jgi:TolA-binding protein
LLRAQGTNGTRKALSLPVSAEKPGAAEEPEVTAEPESQLARETQILQEALSQLRAKDDPTAALEALDRYLNAYPLGLLRKEATSARVEALLKLKRPIDALAALRSYPFGDGARDLELRVLRAELAAGRDCKEALEDFDAVSELVARKAAGPVHERALYGRAACQARLGQRDEAAEGFRAYLRQFPSGRFAAPARRQLGEAEK